jgi:hypothetical protein
MPEILALDKSEHSMSLREDCIVTIRGGVIVLGFLVSLDMNVQAQDHLIQTEPLRSRIGGGI